MKKTLSTRLRQFTLVLLTLGCTYVYGQNTIQGNIKSASDNEALIGVSILIEGTTQGTTTDLDGNFQIDASPEDVLIISYTGMKEIKMEVGNQTFINIIMSPNAILDEVVVTGYGNQLRSNYAGAAVAVDVPQIAQAPRSNFQESLEGNVPGLKVNQGSGQPGAFQNVRIRGLGSINAGTNPLYVIDGIPVFTGNVGNESTTSSPLAGINPQDIKDIQVLKDASATSIYGSRAANGVIIITTKQGQSGKAKVNFNIQQGFTDVSLADDIRPLNSAEYLELMREGLINAGRAADITEANAIIAENIAEPDTDTNWFDEITRDGSFTTANLSISGGNDKTKYFVSGGYQDNEGTVISTGFERYSGRLNLTTELADWLEVDFRTSVSSTLQTTVPDGGAFANPVRSIFRFVPVQPVRNKDGSFNTAINSGFNVVGEALLNTDESRVLNLLGSINARVKLPFIDGLTYEPYFSMNRIEGRDETFFIPDFGTGASRNGFAEADFDLRSNWMVRNLIKYTGFFNDKHGIDITLGHEAQEFKRSFVQTLIGNFAFPSLTSPSNGSEPESISGDKSDNTIESFFLNTNYNYKGLFYVNATIRRDGSSRFGASTRYGTFWSAGVGVNLDRFGFLSGNAAITSLRLRTSYGENGNEAIGNFESRGLYSTGADYLGNPGIFLSQLENANLTWEVNRPFNVGVDLGLWNRINLTLDVYNRRTSDLLFDLPVSQTNGVEDVISNIGELENRGFEILLNTDNIVSSNNGFEWSTTFTFTRNVNEVISLPEGDFADGSRFRAVGQPWSTWYIRGYAGVDTQTGEALWYTDETESETTTSFNGADPYQQGTSEPDFFGGFINTFRFKGFSLRTQFNFEWGGKILHAWHSFTHTDGSRGFSTTGNLARSIYDRRWQQPGDETDTPQFIFGRNTGSRNRSTRFLYDGSYISLRDVTLSYNLPNTLLSKWKINNLRVFAQASNLWVYVKDDRLERDPRTDAGGVIDQEIPIPRTITFGLDVSF